MLEIILFLGILGIVIGSVMATSIATEETRIRQRSIAEVEQRSAQLIDIITTNVHRAEAILAPTTNQSGSMLALQMALNHEFPTIFATTDTGSLLLIQRLSVSPLLSSVMRVSNLQFRNVNGGNVYVSFDVSTTIPLVQPIVFTRHLETTITLFPDDQSQSGGCGTCPAPTCQDHVRQWYVCESETCALSTSTIAC